MGSRATGLTLLLLGLVLMAVLAAAATMVPAACSPSSSTSGGYATRVEEDRPCSVLDPGCEVLQNEAQHCPIPGAPCKERICD